MAATSTLSREAQKIMMSCAGKEREKILRLMFNWPDVVGQKIALNSFPKRIKGSRGKGMVLAIEVANSAIGTELYYMKKEIVTRVNGFLGADTIVDLVVASNYQVANSQNEPVSQDVKMVVLQEEEKRGCDVGDQLLSNGLVELLKAIKTK